MRNYLDLLKKIKDEGVDKQTRNGMTRSLFSHQLRYDLSKGFPAMTTKKLAFRTTLAELLFFIEGNNDNKVLDRLGCTIWDENANADVTLKYAYLI